MSIFAVIILILYCNCLIFVSSSQISDQIGINYGKLGNNLPTPNQTIETLKQLKVGMVKLYEAEPETLKVLAGTRIHVSVMVRNEEIVDLALNESLAIKWVQDNVLSYYPKTMIRFIMVGNEVYSNQIPDQWDNLVLAMTHIRNTLKTNAIHNIKVGTPLAMDILSGSFPPSKGKFRADSLTTMVPLLQLLSKSGSFFFLNVYPYFAWSRNTSIISLKFSLFKGGNLTYTDPVSGYRYTNLLDQMLDSVYSAMTKLGFPDIPIAISETGWPSQGDLDEPGANIYNAATYNRNLVQKIKTEPPLGTPARPGTVIPTFLFSLYDENLKDGHGTERHWGLLGANGLPVYPIDLTGAQTVFEPLPKPTNNEPYKGKLWCVVHDATNVTQLGPTLSGLCTRFDGTCEAVIGPGKDCYEPVSMISHANYIFSAYWAKNRNRGISCFFNGLATLTTNDPSHGTCKFPSVTV